MSLAHLLATAASRHPDRVAVRAPGEQLTYAQLDAIANRVAGALAELGVRSGDRVAVWAPKSSRIVAAMQGVLKLGAAYVPLDPLGPTLRGRTILGDCQVRAVITERARAEEALTDELALPCLTVDERWRGLGWADLDAFRAPPATPGSGDDLAYILYTSGSTGRPKGVCISHRNALAFVEWAGREIAAHADDRFANHAPFHFDLSVLDLYVAFLAGASVSLVPESAAKHGAALVELVHREAITVWYSVPSALLLMMEHGLLAAWPPSLRAVLFAGEPFAVKHVRALRQAFSGRLLNLYGPTETNVCTFHEVGELSDASPELPIGKPCCGDVAWAARPDGTPCEVGEEGELYVSGPTVMLGYWGGQRQGAAPYATGDLVRRGVDGNFSYLGRRDHMVKIRGHRVELGEIEAALMQLEGVREATVVVSGSGLQARLVAFLSCADAMPSLLELKRHLATRLPSYMLVDRARQLPALPRTGNGKVDRACLQQAADELTGRSHGQP